MVNPIDELKVRAKKLQKNSPELPTLLAIAKGRKVQLKHCQHYIARHLGFRNWIHASEVLACDSDSLKDYGTFWYTNKCATSLNHWCKSLSEAKSILVQQGGVILPYKKQFFVATPAHFSNLGMVYEQEQWQKIQGNWMEGCQQVRQSLAVARIKADTTTSGLDGTTVVPTKMKNSSRHRT